MIVRLSSGLSPQCVPGTIVTNYDRSEQEDRFSSDPHPVSGDNGYGTWEKSHPASGSLPNSRILKDTLVRVTEELYEDDETSSTLEALTSTSGPGPPEKEDSDFITVGKDGHAVLENIYKSNDDDGTPSASDREEMWCSPCTQCTDLDLTLSKQLFVCGHVARRYYDIENSTGDKNSAVLTVVDYDASESLSKSEMVPGSSPQPLQPIPPMPELEIDKTTLALYEKPDYKSFNCSLGD